MMVTYNRQVEGELISAIKMHDSMSCHPPPPPMKIQPFNM